MKRQLEERLPERLEAIEAACDAVGFEMRSDRNTGHLLRALAASKPGGKMLELGTGAGLALSWLADGMDVHASILSLDNNPELTALAETFFTDDLRVSILCTDGSEWIEKHRDKKFDLIFADTWPGKYHHLNETLAMLNIGGIYIIDDMKHQTSWPEGHTEKALALGSILASRTDFQIVELEWSTGIIIAIKIA